MRPFVLNKGTNDRLTEINQKIKEDHAIELWQSFKSKQWAIPKIRD